MLICDEFGEVKYPLLEILEKHLLANAAVTILTSKVEDPSKYGEIVASKEGRILNIVEKP